METDFYTIPKAAKILKVTEKTIRNYIDKKILNAEKWNGSWRITEPNLIEVFEKKFGKQKSSDSFHEHTENGFVRLLADDYAELQKKIGQSEADAIHAQELKFELKTFSERVIQLEASAASGWTEARTAKQDLAKTREELVLAQTRENQCREETNWLRRELERMRTDLQELQALNKTLAQQKAILSQQVFEKAIHGSSETT